MEYFYTPPHLIRTDDLLIEEDEFAHLTHVMRKSTGDALRVVDGRGHAFDVTIAEISKKSARCAIAARHERLHEPDVDVTLAVGILKNGSNFDFIIEKTTELGVNAIVPLLTERTIPRHARVDRWEKLALAAMKQSGRCVLPSILPLTPFPTFLHSTPPAATKLIPHEKVDPALALTGRSLRVATPVVICIGPEGGFSDQEIAAAEQAGFTPISLGARRLRTETAAIVSVSSVLI